MKINFYNYAFFRKICIFLYFSLRIRFSVFYTAPDRGQQGNLRWRLDIDYTWKLEKSYKDQGNKTRNVNYCCVFSAYILKSPIETSSLLAMFVNKNRCMHPQSNKTKRLSLPQMYTTDLNINLLIEWTGVYITICLSI